MTDQEIIDHTHFTMLLKGMETALSESVSRYFNFKIGVHSLRVQLKDLRSQITREACVSLSYLCQVLGHVVAPFAISMLPELISLLPNSAKVMAMSAEVCVKFIIRVSVLCGGNVLNNYMLCCFLAFSLTEAFQPHFISGIVFQICCH